MSGLAAKTDLDHLATKQDLEQLRAELRAEPGADVSNLRTEMAALGARLAHTIRNSLIGGMVAMTTVFGGFVAIVQIYL